MSRADVNRLIHPKDRHVAASAAGEAIAGRQCYRAEFRVVLPDGSVRWRRSQGRVEFAGGKPVWMIGAIIEIDKERDR